MNATLQPLFDGIVEGDMNQVRQETEQAVRSGVDPRTILTEGMIPAMAEVGNRFQRGEYYVPEMLIAARAMKAGLQVLKPHLQNVPVQSTGKVVIGSVKGDLHDIGKNLVGMMLEGAGFQIVDLGADVPPEKFVEAVHQTGANLIAMSALLTTTMPNMREVVHALEQAGLRGQLKVMVGGAPLNDEFAHEIGADGYAQDANRAVALAKALIAP
ncbi:MAG: corrinoid protein [Anaerolineae bacterium]